MKIYLSLKIATEFANTRVDDTVFERVNRIQHTRLPILFTWIWQYMYMSTYIAINLCKKEVSYLQKEKFVKGWILKYVNKQSRNNMDLRKLFYWYTNKVLQ